MKNKCSNCFKSENLKPKKKLIQKLTNINIINSDKDGVLAEVIKQGEEIAENVYREQISVEHAEAAERDKEVGGKESEENEKVEDGEEDEEKEETKGKEEEKLEKKDVEDDEKVEYNDPDQVLEENNIHNQDDDEEAIKVTKLRQ
ncbi:uncharacterized protein [Linepithema humile]|uniref:uncharacterized protein n=1 Tax=Linepithema humile TaxID=83485 RepID=UPI00351DEB25